MKAQSDNSKKNESKKTKKSQMALEFLTTYGWAILMLTVMIGVLTYYGIVNPKTFVPSKCVLGPEFSCEDYVILQDGSLRIVFKINVPEGIESLNITCNYEENFNASIEKDFSEPQFNKIELICDPDMGDNIYNVGELKKVKLNIDYIITGGVYWHSTGGEIVRKVSSGSCSSSMICENSCPSDACS